MWKKIKTWIKKIVPQKTDFDDKQVVFRTNEEHLARLIIMKLEDEGIKVFYINKKDSSYNNFGQIELYVERDHVVRAKYIIDKSYE
tara:strand:+ start:8902 stop:9159 length:258 start_codon:yes stop_codon:yes gene_type:complete